MSLRISTLPLFFLALFSCKTEIASSLDASIRGGDSGSALCGNGILDGEDEQCDDGNRSNLDACLNDCTWARCGDGYIRTGVEECDDERGNCRSCLLCPGAQPTSPIAYAAESCVFKAPGERLTIDQARQVCESFGAMVWTPSGGEIDVSVRDTFFPDTSVPKDVWIGISKPTTPENVWYDETGKVVEDTNWSCCGGGLGQEPNYLDAEHCVAAYYGPFGDGQLKGHWGNIPCFYEVETLCEKKPWQQSADHHAYKLFVVPKTWSEAEERCQQLGGHLASIRSVEEDAFVEALATRNIWIGARRSSSEDSFTWSTAEVFDFQNWLDAEPAGQGLCGYRAGTGWKAAGCENRQAYVCEL
jgi:cysteine-rich repeat protein